MTSKPQPIANAGIRPARYLEAHGLRNINAAYWNLGAPNLIEHAIRRHEGALSREGSLVVHTGQFTGRSPKDKFIVRDETTESEVQWGAVNQPMTEAHFDRLYAKVVAFWQGQDVYVQDCSVGADPAYGLAVRIITQFAWHSLFGRQLFIRSEPGTTRQPEFTILFAPDVQADPGEN